MSKRETITHTSGPWQPLDRREPLRVIGGIDGNGMSKQEYTEVALVATVRPGPEAAANAALIYAAPDLLAAAELAVSMTKDQYVIAILSKAIQKARDA